MDSINGVTFVTEENMLTAADVAAVIASRPDKRSVPPEMVKEGAKVIDRALGHLQEMSPGLAEDLAVTVYLAMSFARPSPAKPE